MSSAFILTGKAGDILNALPILSHRAQTLGPQNLIVSKEYAPVVAGLDYVNPVLFDGHWTDFKGAFQMAKEGFDRVYVPQMSGTHLCFSRKTPSVMLDSWERCGYLDKWDTLPLVLPHEPQDKTKSIFYADHSQSSPFFQKEELYKLLVESFPEHQIIRASGMRMKNIRDFLPVMSRASLVVTVETAFLHLSAACQTPVIAMCGNLPSFWHGSPWSKRFALHCRYNDFDARKVEIIAAANRAINGHRTPSPTIYRTRRPHGYNLTIGERASIYRYHPVVGAWQTKLAFEDGEIVTDIEFPKECDAYSLEDARLFDFQGSPHLTYTCSREVLGKWYSIQAYGPLIRQGDAVRVTRHIVPRYKGNDFSMMQKNWCPIVHDGKLFFIFGNLRTSMEQVILQVEGDKIVREHRSPAPSWNWGGIRGGTVVRYKNMLIRFFHSRAGEGHEHFGFRYYVGASIMEPEPPFKTTLVSSFPILAGNEKFTPNCRHWKPNCCLPYGAIVDGESFIVGVGLNDCECATLRLRWSDLHL